MITYALSLSALGREIGPLEAEALANGKLRNAELIASMLLPEYEYGTLCRKHILDLVRNKVIFPAGIHLPFWADGCKWDPSTLDETDRKKEARRFANLIRSLADSGLRAPNLTFHGSREPDPAEHPARLAQTRKTIQDLLPLAQELKFSLNLEFLPRNCIGNCVEELKQLVWDMDPEHTGICFDVNHIMNRYKELPEMIEELAPRIRSFHISDYDGVDECHWMPGQGIIDWKTVMKAIRAIDHDVLLILETKPQLCGAPPQSRKYDPSFAVKQNENVVHFLENCERIMEEQSRFQLKDCGFSALEKNVR